MVMGGYHLLLRLTGQTQRMPVNAHRLVNDVGERQHNEYSAQVSLRRHAQQVRHDCGGFARANGTVTSKDALVGFDFSLTTGAINVLSQLEPLVLSVIRWWFLRRQPGYVIIQSHQPLSGAQVGNRNFALIPIMPGCVGVVGVHQAGQAEAASQAREVFVEDW